MADFGGYNSGTDDPNGESLLARILRMRGVAGMPGDPHAVVGAERPWDQGGSQAAMPADFNAMEAPAKPAYSPISVLPGSKPVDENDMLGRLLRPPANGGQPPAAASAAAPAVAAPGASAAMPAASGAGTQPGVAVPPAPASPLQKWEQENPRPARQTADKQSVLRQIFQALAAGGVGFLNPRAGADLGQALSQRGKQSRLDEQYSQQEQDWEKNRALQQGDINDQRAAQTATDESGLRRAQTGEVQARTEAIKNPPAKPVPQKDEDIVKAYGQALIDGDMKRVAELQPRVKQFLEDTQKPAPEKTGNDFEQYYKQFLTDNHFPDTAHNRKMAKQEWTAASQAPERPPRQTMVIPQEDGTSKVIEVKPGDVIPKGAMTPSEANKESKPTADEQRRADLANNMSENLDKLEEIVTRRPELFGPAAGRYTSLRQAAGTSDPDVAALATIKEQMGMAMVGAHAMRNAQHVEAAANSILNAYKNQPEAILGPRGSIAAARASLKTFTQDAANASTQKGASGKKGDPLGIR